MEIDTVVEMMIVLGPIALVQYSDANIIVAVLCDIVIPGGYDVII